MAKSSICPFIHVVDAENVQRELEMLSHSTMNDCKPSMPRESTNGGPMIVEHGESNGHDAMTNGEKSVVNGFQGIFLCFWRHQCQDDTDRIGY